MPDRQAMADVLLLVTLGTIDTTAAEIAMYEVRLGLRDFRAFHSERERAYYSSKMAPSPLDGSGFARA